MENPSLNKNNAIKSPHDSRDFLYSDVARGSAPFDWNVGYDGVQDLAALFGVAVTIPIKNQNGSGSCGGQSEAYGGAQLSAFHDKVYEEKSAKFTYAPIAYPNGGGSTGRDLSDRSIKFGWGSEALTPSYDNGQPPTEEFMARAADISAAAISHAGKDRALNYALVGVDIEEVAKAIRDFKFVRIGVVGSNNGTWNSPMPTPPHDGQTLWYHWVCGLKAKIVNGKKCIGFVNSWGIVAGEQGWQWLSEDYFKATLSNGIYGNIPVFEPRCYTWNPVPLPPAFSHQFLKDLMFGSDDLENIQLQTALRIDGEFPNGLPYNQHFGLQTLAAVQKFQVKYGISSPTSVGYGRCGPLTRAKLNSLFA